MALTFFLVLLGSGFNDNLAMQFDISLNAAIWIGRLGVLLLPPLAYHLTYRLCLGLQRADRDVLAHGVETGIIKREPHGAFVEIHQPIGPVDDHGEQKTLPYTETPVPKKVNDLGVTGPATPGGLFTPDPPEESDALHRARDDGQAGSDTEGAPTEETPHA